MSKEPKLRPLHDKILIRRNDDPEISPGGIIRPDGFRKQQYEGEVLAVGPGKTLTSGAVKPSAVKPGDLVIFTVFQGQAAPEQWGGKENHWLIREEDLLAVVER